MIVSTGGLTLDQVDDVVSFLEHRGSDFALMHCVSIYPTPDEACNLGNIASFRARYPGRVIGWSTHESPADTVRSASLPRSARKFSSVTSALPPTPSNSTPIRRRPNRSTPGSPPGRR